MLGNPYGRAISGGSDDRFTSFCAPQLFAASLLAILSVLLVTYRLRWLIRLLHISGALLGLLLCGSRYVFLGAIVMVAIIWFGQVSIQRSARKRVQQLVAGICVGTVLVIASVVFFEANTTNRIGEFLAVLGRGESPFSSMGTLVWRKGIYEQALGRIGGRSLSDLCFGSGTSSGASIVLGYDLRYNESQIDANRVVHNEFLRALYEWGVLGVLVFSAVLVSLGYFAFRAALFERVRPALAFLSLLPTVVLGCLSENILAGASSPAGVGFVISLTYGVAYWEVARDRRGQGRSIAHDFAAQVMLIGSADGP
jgi:O-antigen ligase